MSNMKVIVIVGLNLLFLQEGGKALTGTTAAEPKQSRVEAVVI
jgi:hypothetical protein